MSESQVPARFEPVVRSSVLAQLSDSGTAPSFDIERLASVGGDEQWIATTGASWVSPVSAYRTREASLDLALKVLGLAAVRFYRVRSAATAPDPAVDPHSRTDQWLARASWVLGKSMGRPNRSKGSFGEDVAEWWRGDRKLTIYLDGDKAEYLMVWGPDVDAQMQEGDIDSDEQLRELWAWLNGQ